MYYRQFLVLKAGPRGAIPPETRAIDAQEKKTSLEAFITSLLALLLCFRFKSQVSNGFIKVRAYSHETHGTSYIPAAGHLNNGLEMAICYTKRWKTSGAKSAL